MQTTGASVAEVRCQRGQEVSQAGGCPRVRVDSRRVQGMGTAEAGRMEAFPGVGVSQGQGSQECPQGEGFLGRRVMGSWTNMAPQCGRSRPVRGRRLHQPARRFIPPHPHAGARRGAHRQACGPAWRGRGTPPPQGSTPPSPQQGSGLPRLGPCRLGRPCRPPRPPPWPPASDERPAREEPLQAPRRRTWCGRRALAGPENAACPRPRRRNEGWLPVQSDSWWLTFLLTTALSGEGTGTNLIF